MSSNQRVAILDNEYNGLQFVRIPEGLATDVLAAWLGDNPDNQCYLLAIIRGVVECGGEGTEFKLDEPKRWMFCEEHRKTAVAMINAGVLLDDERLGS